MWHCQRKLNLLVYFPIVPLHRDSGLQMTADIMPQKVIQGEYLVLSNLASKSGNSIVAAFLFIYLFLCNNELLVFILREVGWLSLFLGFFFFLCLLSIQKKCIYPIACLPDFCSPGSKMREMKQKGRTGFGRCRRCLPQRDVFSALLEFQAKQKVSREVDQRGHLKVVVLLPGCLKEVVEVSQLPAWDLSDDVGRRRGTCQTCAEWLVPHLTALQLSRVQKTMGLYGWKDVSGSVGHSVFWITCLYTGSNSSYGSPDLQDCDFFFVFLFFHKYWF